MQNQILAVNFGLKYPFLQFEEAHLKALCLTLVGNPACALKSLNLAHTVVTLVQPSLLAKV